jgi:hypothetical protein
MAAGGPKSCIDTAWHLTSAPGLHLGPLVAGEIGGFKREITYLGDAMNTAARSRRPGTKRVARYWSQSHCSTGRAAARRCRHQHWRPTPV